MSFNSRVISTHKSFIRILIHITLKMVTLVLETCR
jgi:hypothetical protein